jgi:aminoglycoside phosphotransferase (APT) family kinase protein
LEVSAPEMQRSSRDLAAFSERFRAWFAAKIPEGRHHEVVISSPAASSGFSSETVLLDVSWDEAGAERTEALVARLAPSQSDVPVFPSYDLRKQYDTVKIVGELTDVPVPKLWWLENDPGVIGSPFYVMGRVDGIVPPDVMPYTFGDNWLFDSSPEDRRVLQDSSVRLLAQLHAIQRAEEVFGFLAFEQPGDTALERHVAHTRAWYEFAVRDCPRSELIERSFSLLEGMWPKQFGETVLSWGDSRIGNVIYRDHRPVAALDWEMAGLGPRELDVSWMIFAHCVFQDLATSLGAPGLPDFMRPDDVIAVYERETGHQIRDLEFYAMYAAIQWGIVFLRTGMRQVHFGEIEMPENPEDLMHHRQSLERMAAGRYWD